MEGGGWRVEGGGWREWRGEGDATAPPCAAPASRPPRSARTWLYRLGLGLGHSAHVQPRGARRTLRTSMHQDALWPCPGPESGPGPGLRECSRTNRAAQHRIEVHHRGRCAPGSCERASVSCRHHAAAVAASAPPAAPLGQGVARHAVALVPRSNARIRILQQS